MDFLSHVKENEKMIVETLKKLLRIPSVLESYDSKSDTPFGENINKALHFMLERGKKDGFVIKNIDNYAAHIEYGEGEDLIGVLTHLDVVPAQSAGWTTPPFEPTIRDGKLFARGSSDDKGPTIAAYFALKFLKDLNVPIHKRVRLIMGTDEETKWRGIEKYFKTEEMPSLGFSPDATFPLIHGEKGIYTFDLKGAFEEDELVHFYSGERYNVVPDVARAKLTKDVSGAFKKFLKHNDYKGKVENGELIVYGKNAHAMTPNLGVNAAFIMAKFLRDHTQNRFIHFIADHLSFDPFGEKLGIELNDPLMKNLTINPGIFVYDSGGGTIGVNIRYPQNFNLKSTALKISNQAKRYRLTYTFNQNMPLHYVEKDEPFIDTLMQSYRKITNDEENEPFTIGGGTYARALDKGVAFGMVMPGRKDVAHQIDEHIHLDDLIEGTAIYMEAIYALTRKDTE